MRDHCLVSEEEDGTPMECWECRRCRIVLLRLRFGGLAPETLAELGCWLRQALRYEEWLLWS